jgi:hypothetical protein
LEFLFHLFDSSKRVLDDSTRSPSSRQVIAC